MYIYTWYIFGAACCNETPWLHAPGSFREGGNNKPLLNRSPVLGTNYLKMESCVPKTGLRF